MHQWLGNLWSCLISVCNVIPINLLYVFKFEISSRYESIFLKLINNVNLVIFTTININETIVRVETVQTTMKKTRKRKEQRLIFKLGTLAPNGINERFSFA